MLLGIPGWRKNLAGWLAGWLALKISGSQDLRISSSQDLKVTRCQDLWTSRSQDLWIPGSGDLRVSRSPDLKIPGSRDLRISIKISGSQDPGQGHQTLSKPQAFQRKIRGFEVLAKILGARILAREPKPFQNHRFSKGKSMVLRSWPRS